MRRLPFLTPAQRRALLLLEWVLLLGIIGVAVWKAKTPSDSPSNGKKNESLSIMGEVWKGSDSLPKEEPFETFPFDPNTADSTSLLRLGLSPWQVRSIYRYRAKHGRYHTPEDFQYLPGMTVEQWKRLKDYIRIAPEFRYLDPKRPRNSQASSNSSSKERILSSEHVVVENDGLESATTTKESLPIEGEVRKGSVKLRIGQTIDINTADTAQLKMIPGIASKRASKIVAYRNKLGGFVSTEQAMEAVEMPDSVLKYMTITPQPVQKINVNKLSVQRLMNHPYLNFYQAKAINEYRRNKGDLHSIEELSRLESFKPTDIDRLRPYVEF